MAGKSTLSLSGERLPVTYDPNFVTPCGKTYAEIDAEQARTIAMANDALGSLRNLGCRWWVYSVSHCTLELVIGDPLARETNLVICLGGCDHITGPVDWEKQQLRVTLLDYDPSQRHVPRTFILQDDSVGFKAVGHVFGWRRDFDIHKHGSLYFRTYLGDTGDRGAAETPGG